MGQRWLICRLFLLILAEFIGWLLLAQRGSQIANQISKVLQG